MLIRILVILICLCATSSFAKIEVIRPDAISDADTFDSTGSGNTKTIMLTDQTDGNYIFSPSVNTDRYTLGDLVATDIDVVDSVVFHWRGQDNGNGANKIQVSARINTDVSGGVNTNLTTSWVDYSDSFTAPPGSRGTWDAFEVDSLVFQIACSQIGNGREARVTECSVVVWYSSSDRTLMFPEKDDACLTSSNFDHDLLRKSAMQNDTAFMFNDDGFTVNDFWKTGNAVTTYHKINNDDWETGGFGVFLDVVHVKADCSLRVRIQRHNSSCVLQESTPYFPASGAKLLIDTTGHYEFQIPQHDWSSGACGDELTVEFEWINALFEADDSVWIRYGSAFTYFEHEIEINKGGCPAGEGAGDCALGDDTDILTLTPNDSGPLNQFVNVGGAGNKILAIADAVDANYMMEDGASQQQNVRVTGITEPADFVSYDSVTIVFRAQRNPAGTGGTRVRLRTRLEDSTNTALFCENTYSNIRFNSWLDFLGDRELTISGAPSGNNTCEGTLDEAAIERMAIRFIMAQLTSGFECRVTSVDMIVCYTFSAAGGAEQNFRRIRMIKMGSVDDKTIWDTYFEQELAVNDEYETSVTFGFPSQGWVWGG